MMREGFPEHIMHNCIQSATDVLSFDTETIVVKCLHYFSIYPVRTTKLKIFCDFDGQNYSAILSHSKIHWLFLFPAIEQLNKWHYMVFRDEKWIEFFKNCDSCEQYSELLKQCQYMFTIPAHNANVERLFSHMNIQWTDERNLM